MNSIKEESPADFDKLKELAQSWPYMKYLLIQLETNLLNTDPDIMTAFKNLMSDQKIANELMSLIMEDHQLAMNLTDELLGGKRKERRSAKLQDSELRNKGLDPLHKIQLDEIKKWRAKPDSSFWTGSIPWLVIHHYNCSDPLPLQFSHW